MERKAEMTCAGCGHAWQASVCVSINVQREPSLAEAFREGRLNVFACPACGVPTRLRAPIVYHDTEARFIAQMVPTATPRDWELQEALAERARAQLAANEGPGFFERYSYRLCFGENQLREKLAILDAKLDDRFVELLKAPMTGDETIGPALREDGAELLFDGIEKEGGLRYVVLHPVDRTRSFIVRVARDAYDRAVGEGLPTEEPLAGVARGPFVNAMRLVVGS